MLRSFLLLMLLVLPATLQAQGGEGPVFGGERPRPAGDADKSPAEKRPQAVATVDPQETLIEALAHWPEARGQEAARELVLQGQRAVPLLLKNLDNNDWRIRCGVAFALGELKEQSAFPKLQKAVRDIANSISLGPFFVAMTRIDPVAATAEILPFVSGADARAAKAAMAALPEVIEQKFEGRIVELTRHRDNRVRFRALNLLSRLRHPVGAEVYVQRLKDRAPRVARLAAEMLAERGDDAIFQTLKDVVLSGSLRASCYAVLALVMAEDRSNRILLDEEGPLKKRLMVFLRMPGDFENIMAAIALANMSMRSEDPALRRFADTALLDYLLEPAATGKIFRDYISVKDLCFRKAALVSGQDFGDRADQWVEWWLKNRKGFHARRRLQRVALSDADRLHLRFACRRGDRALHLELVVGQPAGEDTQLSRPIYITRGQMEQLIRSLRKHRVIENPGMRQDPDWAGDYIELVLLLENSEFRRAHYGEEPEDILAFSRDVENIFKKERWQLFWGGRKSAEFASWFARQKKRYQTLEGEARLRALADDALQVYARLDRRARRAASQCFLEAGDTWLEEHRGDFLKRLDRNQLKISAASELLDILARLPGADVLGRVVEYLPLYSADGTSLLESFLHRRPLPEVLGFDDKDRPDLRVALIPFLAENLENEGVVKKLVSYMEDVDARVQEALVNSLRSRNTGKLLDVMKSCMADRSHPNRLVLMELYGAIGGEEVVGTLEDLYRAGTQMEKLSLIKAWRRGAGPRAVDALFKILQEDEDAFCRQEAMAVLSVLKKETVRQRLRELLGQELSADRLRELMPLCTEVFRSSLEEDFVPFLSHKDEGIRREAALLLGSLGIKAAVPELLKLLLDEVESNRAWEFLELISCHEVVTAGSEEALEAYRQWFKEHGSEAQHEWFMAAMKADGLPAQHMLGYLEGQEKPFRSIALLLRALDSKKWYIRVNAANYLTRIRGARLADLDRRSTPEQIEKARNRWSEWYKAVVEGF